LGLSKEPTWGPKFNRAGGLKEFDKCATSRELTGPSKAKLSFKDLPVGKSGRPKRASQGQTRVLIPPGKKKEGYPCNVCQEIPRGQPGAGRPSLSGKLARGNLGPVPLVWNRAKSKFQVGSRRFPANFFPRPRRKGPNSPFSWGTGCCQTKALGWPPMNSRGPAKAPGFGGPRLPFPGARAVRFSPGGPTGQSYALGESCQPFFCLQGRIKGIKTRPWQLTRYEPRKKAAGL